MRTIPMPRSLAPALWAGLCVLALAGPAQARRLDLKLDAEHARTGDVYIGKNETVKGDLVTTGGSITVDGMVKGDVIAIGGGVLVNGEVTGDAVSMGGKVSVPGRVGGEAVSLGGSVEVAGSVARDISAIGGGVTLKSSAAARGDVAVLGGELEQEAGATIAGAVENVNFHGLWRRLFTRAGALRDREQGRRAGSLLGFYLSLVSLAGIGMILLLTTVFLTKPVENLAAAIKADFWKTAGIGLLILMGIGPALVLLAISVLGIPLIPVALLALVAAGFLSAAAFSLILSQRFHEALRRPLPATIPAVAIGYGLLVSLLVVGKLLKLAGPLDFLGGVFTLVNAILISCGLIVGLGALWTTRAASREVAS